ncbi:MAG TPA: CPBP family glutamic-type intramembrane protease, partial [Gracilimonas sp.]|uniref:CPBP family glutamic-type intramembrane protease n=1 Tax=Gracilimonas sp. TaxID=1974203 RepID=UPI002DA8B9A0|nr:CPBP family glutamic-type intramembrane protease [Gracilimonas sp.]
LFRGAIQPLLGNTLTSMIFISIHGYFKFRSPAHIFFGVLMFGLSFMLGLLFEHVGLISAMIAHTIYDLIMLHVIQNKNN